MSHPFSITAKNKTTGEVTQLKGEFPADEWAHIVLYLESFGRLVQCRMVQSQAQLGWGFSWLEGSPVEYRARFPPEDDVAAFLHRMRPFVLHDDSTSFYRVRNSVARRISIDAVRNHLDSIKSIYNGTSMGFSIEYNGRRLNPDAAVELWLNAFEYHQDEEKRVELRAMFALFPEPAARGLFLHMMLERASAVQQLAAFLERLRAKDGIERSLAGA